MSVIAALIVVMVWHLSNKNKFKKEEPQIILNDKGVETISTGFTSWENIENEQVFISF